MFHDDTIHALRVEVADLEAENKKLRAALREVTAYANLVGSPTDEVHQAVIKLAGDLL